MTYVRVDMAADLENDPVVYYAELDDDRNERRKVHVFQNGTIECADDTHFTDDTELSCEPIPLAGEIKDDPQFSYATITKDEFEEIWLRGVTRQRT